MMRITHEDGTNEYPAIGCKLVGRMLWRVEITVALGNLYDEHFRKWLEREVCPRMHRHGRLEIRVTCGA